MSAVGASSQSTMHSNSTAAAAAAEEGAGAATQCQALDDRLDLDFLDIIPTLDTGDPGQLIESDHVKMPADSTTGPDDSEIIYGTPQNYVNDLGNDVNSLNCRQNSAPGVAVSATAGASECGGTNVNISRMNSMLNALDENLT